MNEQEMARDLLILKAVELATGIIEYIPISASVCTHCNLYLQFEDFEVVRAHKKSCGWRLAKEILELKEQGEE